MIIAGLIFSVVVFTWYVLLVCFRFGVQKSISHSYTLFEQSKESYYTLFMWGMSIPIIIICNTSLGFIAGGLLCIDGAARTGTGDKITQFLHNFGADAGIGFAMIMLWVNYHEWYMVLLFAAMSGLILLKKKNTAWWIEVSAFVVVIIGLAIIKLG